MPENREPIQKCELEAESRHGHLFLLYQSEAEILTPVVPFIQKGVAQGERCIYLNAGEETLERVLDAASAAQKHDVGALVLLPARDTWLKDGYFNAQRVTDLLHALCSRARDDGFKGTRIICDMGWAAGKALKAGALAEFEQGLNLFAARNEVTLLCLYQRGRFPDEQLLDLARLHQQLVIDGKACANPSYHPELCDPGVPRAARELDLFLAAAQNASGAASDRERLRQEREQAYSALARKIYEGWQEEDTLRANEKELLEKDEALFEQRRRLQTVLQHLPVMLMAFDAGHRLASCNHEFERLTGYRAEEVMGKPLWELLEVKEERRAELLSAHPPEGGNYRGIPWSVRCRDGSLRCASWSNFSRFVAIAGWHNWLIGVDLGALGQPGGRPSVTAEEPERRAGELETLGQAVSHDLGGLLARIGGHCTLLQELHGGSLAPSCREIVREIQQAAEDMAGRLTALERFSTLAAGKLRPERVDLSAIVSEIAARLEGTGGRRVTFRIEEGVTATGDARLLRFALEQLLENAWNSTSGVQHPVIRFGTAELRGERSFFVSDNGPRCGVAAAESAPRGVAELQGLEGGIGLATVQRIISLHRGRIWTADQGGRGATFYFRV